VSEGVSEKVVPKLMSDRTCSPKCVCVCLCLYVLYCVCVCGGWWRAEWDICIWRRCEMCDITKKICILCVRVCVHMCVCVSPCVTLCVCVYV